MVKFSSQVFRVVLMTVNKNNNKLTVPSALVCLLLARALIFLQMTKHCNAQSRVLIQCKHSTSCSFSHDIQIYKEGGGPVGPSPPVSVIEELFKCHSDFLFKNLESKSTITSFSVPQPVSQMNSNPDGGLGLSRHLVTASQTYFINGQVHLQCRKTSNMMFFSITTFLCQCYASMKKTSRENLVECKAIKQLKTSSHDVWNNFSKDHIMLTYFALKSACLQTCQ